MAKLEMKFYCIISQRMPIERGEADAPINEYDLTWSAFEKAAQIHKRTDDHHILYSRRSREETEK